MNPPRVLILTAGFGEGHNAAARALAAACDAAHGPGTARLVDAFALASPRLNALARRAYIGMINRTPRLWSGFYAWLDRSDVFPGALQFLRRETRLVGEMIAAERPTVLCSTYPVYAFMLAQLAREGRVLPPHFNIVTDSISINSLWWKCPCEGWFVPNPESAEVIRRAGIAAPRIHDAGFPVTPFFSAHATEFRPPDLAGGATPRVLYIINSGTRHAVETATALLAEGDWSVTCAVGRDENLRRRLEKLTAGRPHPATILGWTDQIPRLLMTHHVVVSKAGGATTQEAIAARCPMIVNQVVPGQEEGNYELLRRHGVGALAETPDAIVRELRRAFADRGQVWSQWRTALSGLARPDAARAIATHVLRQASPSVRGAAATGEAEPIPLPHRAAATA
ncbi:MAG: galactosyldiacylglycerol synthase [Verrucomicrobia bacterium]|nr:galactosyldiacylglycerol synthase [Verrucomicrobiota bacterium]